MIETNNNETVSLRPAPAVEKSAGVSRRTKVIIFVAVMISGGGLLAVLPLTSAANILFSKTVGGDSPPPHTDVQVQAARLHKVKHGDSLWMLASDYYGSGSKWHRILDANKGIIGPDGELSVGQTIVIPDAEITN
jgi:nucleoid-associated protein YgaU